MPRSRALGRFAVPLLVCGAAATGAYAQVAPNRAVRYLASTDVSDAHALWVNPAGIGLFETASLGADVTVGNPGAGGRLEQFSVGVVSRGLGFGYQRDVFAAGSRSHTYRFGYAVGRGGLAAGFATALYRGRNAGTGWDLGLLYAAQTGLTVGGVIANLGQPVVDGVTLPVTYVPGATLGLLAGRAALSVDGRLGSTGAVGYGFGGRASFAIARHGSLGLLARLDTDRSFKRTGFAFGISLGRADVAGLVATTPGDASRVDAVSLYGVSTRRLTGARGGLRD